MNFLSFTIVLQSNMCEVCPGTRSGENANAREDAGTAGLGRAAVMAAAATDQAGEIA